MKKIVVIGSSNLDTTLHVDNFPKAGETINALEVTEAGGGKGANQAIAAAQSGALTSFISRIGDDAAGVFMRKQLIHYGVNPDKLLISKQTATGHAYITLNSHGQNDIIIDHGANYKLTSEDIKKAASEIEAAECIIAQFETPIQTTIEAFRLAKNAGVVTILNPAPAIKKIPEELLHLTDIITPNETECAKITGININNIEDLKASAQKLHQLDIPNVVITYGAKGAFVSNKQIEKLIPAFKVKAVDTTGAGDTFIGYLASQLHSNLDNWEEAATFASCASSLVVQHLGAQPSIPKKEEVVKAMGQING